MALRDLVKEIWSALVTKIGDTKNRNTCHESFNPDPECHEFFHIDRHVANNRTCSLILFVIALLSSFRFRFTPGAVGSDTTTIGDGLLFPFTWPFTTGMMVLNRSKLVLYPYLEQRLSTYMSNVEIHTYDILVFFFLSVLLFFLLFVPVLLAFLDRIRQWR